jgi:hypothetical protein
VKAVISYGLAAIGIIMMVPALLQTFGGLRYLQAKLMLINLLRTNPGQAEMVCKKAKGTFMEALGMAITTAAATQSRDPAVLQQSALPAFDATGIGVSMHWKGLVGKAKIGIMLCGAGVVLAIMSGGSMPIPLLLLTLACVGAGAWMVHKQIEADRAVILARAELIPEVIRVFVDGRYVKIG